MKKYIAMLLAVACVLSCTPAVFAAGTDDAIASTSIQFAVDNIYSVTIPEVYDLNDQDNMQISVDYCHLAADKQVSLYLMNDKVNYTGSGTVTLYGCSTGAAESLECTVLIGESPEMVESPITMDRVCTFYGDGGEISFLRGGYMRLDPQLGAGATCGEYSGNVCFEAKIESLNY